MSYLDVLNMIIWVCPRLRVPVPPSCVHRDRRPDLTVSGAHSPRFVFLFFKSLLFCAYVLSVSRQGSCRSSSRSSPRKMRGSSAGPPRVPRVLWSRALFGPPAGALPSPPAGCLVTGLPLPQARRSREITPPDRADSMPAGPPLTQCPPDCRWLMPAGLPLTQAHRIGADSCPLAAAYPSPVESPHVTARSAVCLFCCAHRNILIKSCLVMSTETRLGQAAPLVVAMEAILAACPLVVEAVAEGPCEGLWLLVMPRRSLSLRASPGGLPVPVGCPVLSVWPWRAVLYCSVWLLIPPDFPEKFFWGG